MKHLNFKLIAVLAFSLNFFQAISQNLLTNGSFESGTTSWTNLAGDGGVASYLVTDTDAIAGIQFTASSGDDFRYQPMEHPKYPQCYQHGNRFKLYLFILC